MDLNFDIDWRMAGCRAIMIKMLSEKHLKELHELENTRGKRNKYREDDNWLIVPFNIRRLFYADLKDVEINNNDIEAVIDLIKNQIPKDIQGMGSHSASTEFQHAWDWSIFYNTANFNKGEN